MNRIEITDAMHTALAAIEAAENRYTPGLDSSAVIELPKLALADAVLAAIAAQHADRLTRLPQRAPVVAVVDVSIRPKRRRA